MLSAGNARQVEDALSLPDDFKEAMRRLAATVCILTTMHDGQRWGLTATAVCSLSAAPPSLIVCINRDAEAYPAMKASGRICVNLVSDHQQDTAERFSGMLGHKGEARFEHARWTELPTGVPVLIDAVAALDCRIRDSVPYATHIVLFCEVDAVSLGHRRTPLLYGDRNFCDLISRAVSA